MPFDIPVAFFEAAMTLVHGHGGRIVDHSCPGEIIEPELVTLCRQLHSGPVVFILVG